MSEGIDFDLPIWSATVLHNTPDTDGIWLRAFNSRAGDEAAAMQKMRELYVAEGLSEIRIFRIELTELEVIDDGGS